MNHFRIFIGIVLLATLPMSAFGKPSVKARPAPPTEAQIYHRAFALLSSGHADQAYAMAGQGKDPVLNRILRAADMAQPGTDISFIEMSDFVSDNPDWPNLKGILAIAEQKIPPNTPLSDVIAWFRAHPPQTINGFYRYIDALDATGQTSDVNSLILARWIDGDFSPDELVAFHARYEHALTGDANWMRLDRLLWKNDVTNARRAFAFATDDMKATAEARLALANQSSNAEYFLNRVPPGWQHTPGLLYERLRWYVRTNHDDDAVDLLMHAPADLGKAEPWWEQRQLMVHRNIQKHNFAVAYQLAAEHGQTENKTLVQAEFLAGWLALRFLNEPESARMHFQALYDSASTPVSRARGAYWLGRTFEVLNDRNSAEQAYENAAAFNITYYGQLATTRLFDNPVIRAAAEPPIPQATRQEFLNRNSTRAIERLHAIGEDDRAKMFFHAATEAAQRRVDYVMLIEQAYRIQRPDLAIEAAKAANQKNFLIGAIGFPLINHPIPQPPEAAFTHALIRQESMFNPDATSPVGAHGLMQLMRGTAADVARKLDIKFIETKLENPDYNLKLGTSFVQQQIDGFNGSYVLALAGYNAGPRRVRDWMTVIGDPRSPDVDPVDWVEAIPLSETRNYVQRIIESLQVYRARLNNGQAPLLILKDLKR
jgi:soluble lytic murein transglycosylase